MGIGKALSKGMGLLPALASGAMGEKNKGFALGIIPGMIYKDQAKDEEAEKRRQQEEAAAAQAAAEAEASGMKKGGRVKKAKPKSMSSKPKASSASKRADGCAQRGKTKGRMV
jgi:hypothetical protein